MRVFMSFALALFGFALAQVPAAQAATHWKCMGPSYACSSAKRVAAKRTYKKTYAKKKYYNSGYKKKKSAYKGKKYRKYAKRTSGKKRYSGGGGYHGMASFYWQPQRVASGGWFNPNALTAAHKTLPFGTRVRVTNKRNGRSVVVRINDRGPFIKGRIIDLSRRAAGVIGMRKSGVAPVSVQVLGRG